MRQSHKFAACMAALVGAGLLLSGCGTPMSGSPSLSLLSSDLSSASPNIKVIGEEVEDSDTLRWIALFVWHGPQMHSHEAIVTRLLEQNHADLLVDSEMEISTFGIPYIYMEMKSTVRGRPAVFVKEGAK